MNVQFSSHGWEDYLHWQQQDRKVVRKINDLIRDIARNPHDGLGKPEALKHALAGYWSRRVTEEHRLVYRVEGRTIQIVQCRYHYQGSG